MHSPASLAEYGFPSWIDLKSFVEASRAQSSDPAALETQVSRMVYAGDIAGGMDRGPTARRGSTDLRSPESGRAEPLDRVRGRRCRSGVAPDREGAAVGQPAWRPA